MIDAKRCLRYVIENGDNNTPISEDKNRKKFSSSKSREAGSYRV